LAADSQDRALAPSRSACIAAIIPVFEKPKRIADIAASLLSCGYGNLRIILVVDGSRNADIMDFPKEAVGRGIFPDLMRCGFLVPAITEFPLARISRRWAVGNIVWFNEHFLMILRKGLRPHRFFISSVADGIFPVLIGLGASELLFFLASRFFRISFYPQVILLFYFVYSPLLVLASIATWFPVRFKINVAYDWRM
jgi:hypothetical protein